MNRDKVLYFLTDVNTTLSCYRMTYQESAGSFQSVKNGLPNTATGVLTNSCCYQGIYNRMCAHNGRSGKEYAKSCFGMDIA